MKKNLENTIATLVANQLNEVKEQVSKSKTTKGQKTKKQLVKKSKEAAEEFANAKLVELKPKGKKSSKKEETIKEVKQQQSPSIIEQVISNREVKYVYPSDITDTLARKKWRQQTRNELHRLEREMFRIKDQNSKEFKDAAKKYKDFKKKVLKPEQVA